MFEIIEDPESRTISSLFCRAGRLYRRPRRLSTYEDEEEEASFVRSVGNDVLFSNRFQDSTYAAFLSPDRTALQLIPCEGGGIRSVMGSIQIKGLDEIVGERIGQNLKHTVEDGVVTLYFD